MIATQRFVFLHLHKSGGTFVNECLLRHLPDARRLGYHLPRSMLPAPLLHLPVLGLVRNPWSYYVSWYSFQRQRPQPNLLFRVLSDDGRLDFAGTLRNMLELGAGSPRLDTLLRGLPGAYGDQGLNLPGFALEPIRGTQLGFYSYLYRYLYTGGHAPAVVGKLEEMRVALPAMLRDVAQLVHREMQEFIDREQPRNISSHASYMEYYDAGLRDLVARHDAGLIERYGYRFGA